MGGKRPERGPSCDPEVLENEACDVIISLSKNSRLLAMYNGVEEGGLYFCLLSRLQLGKYSRRMTSRE